MARDLCFPNPSDNPRRSITINSNRPRARSTRLRLVLQHPSLILTYAICLTGSIRGTCSTTRISGSKHCKRAEGARPARIVAHPTARIADTWRVRETNINLVPTWWWTWFMSMKRQVPQRREQRQSECELGMRAKETTSARSCPSSSNPQTNWRTRGVGLYPRVR
ncbi:hypothetical protein BD410DRAFT_510091 [Rickenella mellea]|uniref:Uncharacterized protein n=1 Tax=Rickenella mellea TaxID=50990 RepID=A0A4Y7PRY0_9AGAM|nr:hypothetical protein BD410DRAFT_510091 [Rickenella mellea]